MIPNDIVDKILTAVDEQFDLQLSKTAELVGIPSLRTGEEPAQDFIMSELRALGLEVDRWELDSPELRDHPGYGKAAVDYKSMTNLVGTYKPSMEAGKSLILNGHIDVVPEGPHDKWTRSPWEAEIRDGWMYGRGAGDMKAGLVANLFAFDAVRKAGMELTGRVHLQSVVEEECTGNGSLAALLRGYTADAVVISEPEEDALVRANVGVLWFTVRVSGEPTHPREMVEGFNAIDAAYKVIDGLRHLERQWNDDKGNHPYFEDVDQPINFNIGGISGGDWPSSVPAWCEIQVRVSTYPGTSADDAWGEIVQHVNRVAHSSGRKPFEVELTQDGFYSEGYVLEPGGDAERLLGETHRASFGQELTTFTTPGYLDARVFINYGDIPTLVYGPVSENIHGFDERVDIESVRRCTQSMALFLASWCGVREVG